MEKTAVVTGGNRGIGAAMARLLAKRGYAVKIVCRDPARADAFIGEMKSAGITGIEPVRGDFGSLDSIRDAASEIRKACPEFSCFIHNAGMWPVERAINRDGLEQSFVTNHLAPFYLNRLLEDLFIANKARIVQISAGLYVLGKQDCIGTATGENFSLMKTYATTKLLNLVATMEFARRWKDKGVTITAIHPGVVKTGLGDMKGIRGAFLRLVKNLWMDPQRAAEAPVALATDPSFAGVTGAYFNIKKRAELEPVAADERFAEEVWSQAERLCGVSR